MIAETLDVILGFFGYPTEEVRVARISGTSKDKVLPYQDTHLVRCFIKAIVFINAPTPHTEQVMIGVFHILHQLAVTLRSHFREEGIIRNEVRPFGKHRLSVHHEVECLSILVVFQYHLDITKADALLFRSHQLSFCLYGDFKIVQGRFSPSVRHPQVRMFYLHGDVPPVHARFQGHFLVDGHWGAILIRIGKLHFHLLGSVLHTFQFQSVFYLGQLAGYGYLLHIIVLHACHIEELQGHGTPDATGSQSDAPIPTEAIRSLASEDAHALVAMVIVGRIDESVRFPLGQGLLDGRMKIHLQTVLALAEHLLHGQGIAHEHVVRTLQQGAVQVDVCVSVQALEFEHRSPTGQLLLGHLERSLVHPVLLFHPLHLLLVQAEERVLQPAIVYQVLMNGARNGSRKPFPLACLGEFPSLVQGHRFRFLVLTGIQQHRETTCQYHGSYFIHTE